VAAYLETQLPWRFFGWAPLAAVRHDGWKLVAAPRPELYDLARDAGETRNLLDPATTAVGASRDRARALREEMRRLEALPVESSAVLDDPEAMARLQALGYLGAGGGDATPPQGLPDPKDRLEARDELLAADAAVRAGRLEEGLARFDRVLAVEPRNRFATLRSGIALLKAGRLEAAVARLEVAVGADPGRAEARFALADAWTRLGRHAQALPQWLELVRLQPRTPAHWTNLAFSLRQNGQEERAAAAMKEAAALAAAHAAANEP
jgi:tetratricopeptide (TPR) repeat protein